MFLFEARELQLVPREPYTGGFQKRGVGSPLWQWVELPDLRNAKTQQTPKWCLGITQQSTIAPGAANGQNRITFDSWEHGWGA
jgi:hypothetical protein